VSNPAATLPTYFRIERRRTIATVCRAAESLWKTRSCKSPIFSDRWGIILAGLVFNISEAYIRPSLQRRSTSNDCGTEGLPTTGGPPGLAHLLTSDAVLRASLPSHTEVSQDVVLGVLRGRLWAMC